MGRIKKTLEEKIIKVYYKKDAPKGAIFVSKVIERNGLLDISTQNKKVLKPNERIAYLYRISVNETPSTASKPN
ncbi:MAG TPA: hypothetical protein VLB84_04455 [Bacteroidia bacterium]|jgi:hypothetical protein|nr:hypothetical protein [Bacteroidia bacterium]